MKKLMKYAIYAGLFGALFIPLVVTNGMYFPFISGKGFAFRMIVEVVVALWAVLAIYDASYRPRVSLVAGSVLSFLGIMGLATLFAENPHKSFWSNYERMEGYITLLHLAGYFIVLGTMITQDRLWNRFWHTSIGISVFLAFYGFVQLSGLIVINQGGARVDGTFGNAAYFAAYMLFSIFITAFFWLTRRGEHGRAIVWSWLLAIGLWFGLIVRMIMSAPKEAAYQGISITVFDAMGMLPKIIWVAMAVLAVFAWFIWRKVRMYEVIRPSLYVLAIVLQFIALYYTATRGAMVGLVVGLFIAGILFARRQNTVDTLRKGARIGLVVLVVLIGLFMMFKSSTFVQRSDTLARFATLVSGESLVSQAAPRLAIWNMAIEGFKERPFLGWGQENFNFVFNKYYDPSMYDQEQWFDRTHNIFLDWLVAGGALGLLGYLSLYASSLYYIWSAGGKNKLTEFVSRLFYKFTGKQEARFGYTEQVLLTALLSAYFAQNFFVFDNLGTYILFFSFLAFIHSTVAEERRKIQNLSFGGELSKQIIAGVLLVLMVVTVYGIQVQGVYANRNLILGMATREKTLEKNLEYFKAAQAFGRGGREEVAEQVTQFAIRVQGNAGVSQEEKSEVVSFAQETMRELIEEVPNNARLLIFHASLLDALGRSEEARVYINRAIELSPNKQGFIQMLAVNYLDTGDVPSAMELFKKAYELDTRNKNARNTYGLALLAEKQKERADEILLSDLYSEENRFVPNDQVVRVYFDTYQALDTVLEIRKASVELYPHDPQQYVSLAAAYLALNQNAPAIEAIQKAIEIDPAFSTQGNQIIQQIQSGRTLVN